jgi:transcriptional regulator with XRE-family HTH domain
MADTLKLKRVSEREAHYYRQRQKNRVFGHLTAFFAEEAARRGITKKDIAEALGRDPAQITRWLSAPSNLTLDSISDLLTALEAEMDSRVVRNEDRPQPNYVHPLIGRVLGQASRTKVTMNAIPPSVSTRVTDVQLSVIP